MCAGYAQTSQQQAQQQQPLEQEGVPYGSRLSSYTSAASRTATPKAADCSSWNGSLDSSASYAAAQVRERPVMTGAQVPQQDSMGSNLLGDDIGAPCE